MRSSTQEKLKKKTDFLHRKIVKELKELEDIGIEVGEQVHKIAVHMYLGDNLEIHEVAGLQTHFNSGYICRLCLIDHKDLIAHEGNPARRTEEMYNNVMQRLQEYQSSDEEDKDEEREPIAMREEHNPYEEESSGEEDNAGVAEVAIEEISDGEAEAEDNSNPEAHSNLGWKKRCEYNKLNNFCSLTAFPFDILHDMLEGVFSYDIPCIIKYYIKKKQFSLNDLNTRLQKFEFSRHEMKDKPVAFLNEKFTRLPGKGKSSCLLMKILPYLLQPLVNLNLDQCQMWKCMSKLHRIREITMAEKFNSSLILELDENIYTYFVIRGEIPEFCTPKPKHHYITHLPESISYYGPPTLTWTARYL